MSHYRYHAKTVYGVTYVQTHTGQKRAYGDSFDEYEVTSDLPATEVERICSTKIMRAIPVAEYSADYKARPISSNYFRASYTFRVIPGSDGKYFYSVCFPYTD